jgi:pyridoxamine 5'-phosphate oxidase
MEASPSPGNAPDHGPDPTALAALRREYGDAGLDLPDLAPDPVSMFDRWLGDTVAAGVHEPNAMVVASVSAHGLPSTRMVLLKAVDERGFVFYTNYESRKGHELDADPACSLLFPWHDLQRQVRVEGRAERVSREESEAYFASRPRGSQLGAWASPQSEEVAGRDALEERYAKVEARFAGAEVPLPPQWGGYRIVPDVVEFWQGRKGRMHDRLVYRRAGDGSTWSIERLAP